MRRRSVTAVAELIEPLRGADRRVHRPDAGPRLRIRPSRVRAPRRRRACRVFEGFHTIERIGAGGMGEVFKLRDLRLDRIVAAKVLRPDAALPAGVAAFLGEARSLALFSDRRIVRLLEFRPEANPPVLIMEHVEGFELGRIGPSLEFRQRARVLHEVCLAIGHAHALGIQHRDLKPSNIMVDAQLVPRILDFGLSGGDPKAGHLKGTLQYVAPEQLEPSQPIDERTDVYALGVILYELLCGRPPYTGSSGDILAGIRRGQPRLPIELSPDVPEGLQAVALKAMERDPAQRYPSAREMAADLERYLDGRPVLARPSVYTTTLGDRAAAHLAHIDEWLRLRLIHPHEAGALRAAYRALDARDDDWIVESRALTYPQIALYLGAFLLVAGSLFYFVAERWYGAVSGLVQPLLVLGLPFAGLNLAAHWLHRRDHKAVAVAFYLAAVALLPLLLIIVFHETGFLVVAAGHARSALSGRVDFQPAAAADRRRSRRCGPCTWRSPREPRLSARCSRRSRALFAIAVLADFGLRSWLVAGAMGSAGAARVPARAGIWGRRCRRRANGPRLAGAAAVSGRRGRARPRPRTARAQRTDLPLPRFLAAGFPDARRSAIRCCSIRWRQ